MILQLRKQMILLLLIACWADSLEGRHHPMQKRRAEVLRGRRQVRALVTTSEDTVALDGKGMKDSIGKEDGKEGSNDWREFIETGNSLDAKAGTGTASSADKASIPKGSSSSGDSTTTPAASRADKKSSKRSNTSKNSGSSTSGAATSGAGTSKVSMASKQSYHAASDDDHKNKLSSKSKNSKGSKSKSKTKSSGKLSKKSRSASNKAKQMKLTKKASSVKGNTAKGNSAKQAAEVSMKASSKDESSDEGPVAAGGGSMVPPSGDESPASGDESMLPPSSDEIPIATVPPVVDPTDPPVVDLTDSPIVEATDAPATEAPVVTDPPAETTDAPAETTDAPDVPATDAPIATDPPIGTTEAPVEVTDAPATEAPVLTDAPVMTVAPTEALTDATVVEETVAPTEVTITEPPVTTTAPTEAVTAEETDEPSEAVTEAPVESTLAPTVEITSEEVVDDDFFTVPNDICVDAIELEVGDIVFGSTGSATGNEGVDACDDAVASLFPEASDGFSIQQLGVWYAVEASDTRLRASVCSDTGNELAPMVLTIYAGNDNCSELSCAPVYNTASCSVEWVASSDYEMYYILVQSLVVEGTPLDVETDLEFELRLSEPVAPRNDICEESVMLEYGDTIAGQTLSASVKDIEGACALELQPPSSNVLIPAVWFTVIGNGNSLIASTCNESTESGPILVTIYSGSCGSLVCETLDVSDVGPCSSGITSTVEGQTYYVVVEKVLRGNDEGVFELAINDPE